MSEPFRLREKNREMVAYLILLTGFIFYVDVITPLGLTVWILYFIPLFLTLYIRWRHAPFMASGAIILLLGASLFLSPRDMSVLFALANRVFFSLMLIVSAYLIWSHKQQEEILRVSEERFRYLADCSPDAILAYGDGKILYTNPAGMRLLGAAERSDLIGKDLADMVHADDRDTVRQRITQAALGGRMELPGVRMIRRDGREVRVDVRLGGILWDRKPAVEITIRVMA